MDSESQCRNASATAGSFIHLPRGLANVGRAMTAADCPRAGSVRPCAGRGDAAHQITMIWSRRGARLAVPDPGEAAETIR